MPIFFTSVPTDVVNQMGDEANAYAQGDASARMSGRGHMKVDPITMSYLRILYKRDILRFMEPRC